MFCTETASTNAACRSNIRLNAFVEFDVFTVVKSHIVMFWVLKIYVLVGGVHCFGMECCCHFQVWEKCQAIVHAVEIKTPQERQKVSSKLSVIQSVFKKNQI